MNFKLRYLILAALFVGQIFCYAHAGKLANGIVVYAEGQRTCYLFSQMPTVTYKHDNNDVIAQLSIDQASEPVLSIRLKKDTSLIIEYGEVEESDNVNTVTMKHQGPKNGKYIQCGHLIIVKDGILYNADGTKLKNIQKH